MQPLNPPLNPNTQIITRFFKKDNIVTTHLGLQNVRLPWRCKCSRHGFLYIRGWMQMVMAPNNLFSWNNKYNKYIVTKDIYTFFLMLCTWTHSVHARILKPWRGSLPWLPAISSSCHVFLPPLSGLNWRSLSPLGNPVPLPPKWRPFSQGPRTLPYRDPEQ